MVIHITTYPEEKNERSPGEIQKEIYQEWINLGFGQEVALEEAGYFASKGYSLPAFSATTKGSKVRIAHIANNFFSTFIGLELKKPLPVTLFYPISDVLNDDLPISSHVDHSFPPMGNFQLSYHTRKPIKKIGLITGLERDILIPSVIRYLDLISLLPASKVFDIVLDKTHHGKKDRIDRNAINSEELASAIKLPLRSSHGSNLEVKVSQRSIFERLVLNENDRNLGGSSVEIRLREGEPLPYLTVPYDSLYFPTTTQIQDMGFREWINCISFDTKRGKHLDDRKKIDSTGIVAPQYKAAEWGEARFRVRTPNILDTMLTALYLEKVVSPLVREVREKISR